jgi:hypothetical protein
LKTLEISVPTWIFGTTEGPFGTTERAFGTTESPFGTTQMLGGTAQSAFGTTRFTLLALKILLKHEGCAQKK